MLLFDENEKLRLRVHNYNNLPNEFIFFDGVEGTRGYLGVPLLVERDVTQVEFWQGYIKTWLSGGLVGLPAIVSLSPSNLRIIYQGGRNQLFELDRETLTSNRIER